MFYALCTNQDEIAEKVNLFVALAPVVRFVGAKKDLKWGMVLEDQIDAAFKKTETYGLFGSDIKEKEKLLESNPATGPFINAFKESVMGSSEYQSEKWI